MPTYESRLSPDIANENRKMIVEDGEVFEMEGYDMGVMPEVIDPKVVQESKPRYNDMVALAEYAKQSSGSLLRRMEIPSHLQSVLPYTFMGANQVEVFGDFFSRTGESALFDAYGQIENRHFEPSSELNAVTDAIHIVRKNPSFKHNERVVSLRGLTRTKNRWSFTVGPAHYADFYFSNGSDNLSLLAEDHPHLTVDEREELQNLVRTLPLFKGKPPLNVRQALYASYGGLPPFDSGFYSNTIGVATILTTSDNDFVFVERNPVFVGVNPGVNCPASGGVEWDENVLRAEGLVGATTQTMRRESSAELGLKIGKLITHGMAHHVSETLGLSEDDGSLSFVGGARELPRGGSPEFLFLTQSSLSTRDVIGKIQGNTHPEKLEGSRIFVQPIAETYRMLSKPGSERYIQPKAVLNLLMVKEFFKEHGIQF